MRRTIAIAALAALALCARSARADDASDPRAVAIADQVMQALGGHDRWASLTGIRWSFGSSVNDTLRGSRRHSWDKHTGQHVVSGKLRDGTPFRVVHTVGDTLHGQAWVGGRAVADDSVHTWLARAQAMWVNDTYWMLMPYKLRDPGVTLKYDSEVKDSLGTFDRIALSFGNVGLTPGDHYWVDVDRANHRVERWQYVLQGTQPPPVRWTWEGWEQHSGLWFPTVHRQGRVAVLTNQVETVDAFPPSEFAGP